MVIEIVDLPSYKMLIFQFANCKFTREYPNIFPFSIHWMLPIEPKKNRGLRLETTLVGNRDQSLRLRDGCASRLKGDPMVRFSEFY